MGNENKNPIARNNRYFTCMEVLQTTLKKESNKNAALLLKKKLTVHKIAEGY